MDYFQQLQALREERQQLITEIINAMTEHERLTRLLAEAEARCNTR